MKLANLLLGVPIAILVIVVALANRHGVIVSFDPFAGSGATAWAFEAPLFFVIFLFFLAGFGVGGFAAWSGQGKWRKATRQGRKEVKGLGRQIEAHQEAKTALRTQTQSSEGAKTLPASPNLDTPTPDPDT